MPISDLLPSDPLYGAFGAQLIRALVTPNSTLIQDALLGGFGGTVLTKNVVIDYTYPVNFAKYVTTAGIVVVLSGCQTTAGAQGLARSWAEGPDASAALINQNWCRIVQETSDRIMGDPALGFGNASIPVHVFGHSLGGAIGYAIAQSYARSSPNVSVYCSTYGSPRVQNHLVTGDFRRVVVLRWVNTGDNVPSFPPDAAQSPLLHGALGRRQSQNSMRWQHPTIPYAVNETGGITPLSAEIPGDPFTVTTLLQAFASPNGTLSANHSIITYADRLTAAAVLVPPAAPPPAPTPPVPEPPPITTPAQQIAADRALIAFREATNLETAIGVTIPKITRFAYYKSEGLWYLSLYGGDIATHTSKRKMQALARSGNHFLRLFQDVGMAASPTFIYCLTKYLIDAARPDGPFVPVLNDGGIPPPPINL